MALRIDSPLFLLAALGAVAALRLLPRTAAVRYYGVSSLGVWLASIGDGVACLLALCFAFLPFLVVRVRRTLPDWAKTLVFCAQIGQLLWLRRYFPPLGLPAGVIVAGVSYMLLRQIEWLLWIDADDGEPVDWFEYTAFLTGVLTLLAGPIARYRDFRASFGTTPSDEAGLVQALHRIVNGYFKAALLAPLLGEFTRGEWLQAHASSRWAFAVFLFSYPWYLYLNFAGYCDIVIGLGRLGNARIPENFDRPFLATNIRDFWGRWHITFSNWIRVHVFFPLVRFTRTGPVRLPEMPAVAFAVLVTFLIVGAWHGPKLGFLVFAMMHALGMLVVTPYGWLLERVLGERGMAVYHGSRWVRALRVAACFSYLALSMLFFEREPAEVQQLLQHLH